MLRLDLALLRLLRTRGHTPAAERAVALYSRCGEHGFGWLALCAAGWLLDAPNRRAYARAAWVVLGVYALNTLVKALIRRPRPVLEGLPPLAGTYMGLAYPSAHASTSFAAACALRPALPPRALTAAAAAMALSRPYLGVHYPSDVVAGAAFGHALARLAP